MCVLFLGEDNLFDILGNLRIYKFLRVLRVSAVSLFRIKDCIVFFNLAVLASYGMIIGAKKYIYYT